MEVSGTCSLGVFKWVVFRVSSSSLAVSACWSRELSHDGELLGTEQTPAVLAALTTVNLDFQSATPIYQGAPAQLREQLSLGCEEVCNKDTDCTHALGWSSLTTSLSWEGMGWDIFSCQVEILHQGLWWSLASVAAEHLYHASRNSVKVFNV